MPNASISSDFIAGFCTETEEQHRDTITLMEEVAFDFSYMYYYSERPGTLAAKKYEDDVPLETKKRRLQEIIDLQNKLARASHKRDEGKTFEVLVEGTSKKSEEDHQGRNSQNNMVIFPKGNTKIGDLVMVKVLKGTQSVLIGELV